MHKNNNDDKLSFLYAQIEDIYRQFKIIQGEASGILQESTMPDNTAQLKDVIASTEKAAITILDTACAITDLVQKSPAPQELKDQVASLVTVICETCSFQDISGQRIKKVLGNLSTLEDKLASLADVAKSRRAAPSKTAPSDKDLMNGPALNDQAPSQSDIDNLFNQA